MPARTNHIERVRLDSIAAVQPGYAPRAPADERSASPWRIVLGRHAGEGGRIDWADLPPCEPVRTIERFALQEGDVLLTIRTTNLRAIIALDVPPHTVASAQFALLRPRPGHVDAHYLAWLLNGADTRGRLRSLFKGSSIPFLPVANLTGFEIPLPSLDRQRAVARVLEVRRREDELRQQLDHALDVLIDAASQQDTTLRMTP